MPPSNPNQGTGYVDWGNYVNANQPTIDADRKKVGDYLGQMDTQARGTVDTAPQRPDVPDLSNGNTAVGNAAKYTSDMAKFNQNAGKPSAYGNMQQTLQDAQGALASPTGFSQVLANANANYNLNNAAGQGYAKAPYDPWSSALEGQNAQGLYNKADTLAPKQPDAAPAGPAPAQNQQPTWDAPGPGEGPTMKPKANPQSPEWDDQSGRPKRVPIKGQR